MKKNVLWALTGFALIGIVLASCNDAAGGGGTDPALSGAITISPSGSVTTGTPLTAAYSGTETVTYQWNKDGTAIPTGGTNQTYTPTAAGSYTVTVSAAGYSSKTSAAVTVTVDPVAEMNAADFGDGVTPTTLTISSKADFETAKAEIEGTAGNYVLTITGTVDVDDTSINPAADTVVSLRGGGTLDLTGMNTLFYLDRSDSKVILRDAVLKGNASNSGSLVSVDKNSAAFVMYGGTITGNTSGGGGGVKVCVGIFTMKGGTISGNTVGSGQKGGGVYVDASNGATFTKTGGTIYGKDGSANQNEATDGDSNGHAVFVDNGGSGDKYRDTTAGTGVNLDSGDNANWGE